MLSGFYTAGSGMLMQQRTLNVLSNNMANSKTPGYRATRVVSTTFDHELMIRQDGLAKLNLTEEERAYFNNSRIGSGSPIRIVEEVPTSWEQGFIEETGRPYDVALGGNGLFTIRETKPPVQNPDGEVVEEEVAETPATAMLFTRNGSFDVDTEGFLILPGIGRVQGEKGDIKVGGSNFIVEADGTIINDKGRTIDRFLVVDLPAEQLQHLENGRYALKAEAGVDAEGNPLVLQSMEEYRVYQNTLELSNVNVNREMMTAMESQRAFQACAKAIGVVDQMNAKAASQIAGL